MTHTHTTPTYCSYLICITESAFEILLLYWHVICLPSHPPPLLHLPQTLSLSLSLSFSGEWHTVLSGRAIESSMLYDLEAANVPKNWREWRGANKMKRSVVDKLPRWKDLGFLSNDKMMTWNWVKRLKSQFDIYAGTYFRVKTFLHISK